MRRVRIVQTQSNTKTQTSKSTEPGSGGGLISASDAKLLKAGNIPSPGSLALALPAFFFFGIERPPRSG
jgi:hypothetical protein